MHPRTALAAVFAALVSLAPAVTPVALAATTTPAATGPSGAAVAIAPKVVIVVGTVEGSTSSYRAKGDEIYAEAIKWTPNVVKVYSPNATWAAVKTAAQGASIFIYLGHGNGWPSPYSTSLKTDRQDGMGLNEAAGHGDSNKHYYGEAYIASGIRLAANAIVFLDGLCYAPGASEPGNAEPTVAVAKQRVDNFASGFIRAGARAVYATDFTPDVTSAIQAIFTTSQTMLSVFRAPSWSYHGNDIVWTPARNPAFVGVMDPQTPTTGFKHSIVTDADFQTSDVLAGASEIPTASTPASLTAPGAASVTAAGLPVYTDQDLATVSVSTLAAGTTVRVDDVVPSAPAGDGSTPPPAVQVHTLDGATSGWVSGAGLTPRDSSGPELWSTTGPTTISPNFDGNADSLQLWDRLSEVATWTATVTDPDGHVLRTQTGTSDMPAPSWDGLVGGQPADAGTYHWTLHAADAWGNPALDASGDLTVVSEPIPTTAVLAFKSLNGTATRSSTLSFELDFATPVTSVGAGDLLRSGTAAKCSVHTPTGGGTTWTVTLTGCTDGSVQLTLKAGHVLDASLVAGPPVDVVSPSVKLDRVKPTEKAPAARFQSGNTLSGSWLPETITWGATDAVSGVASYDVARSVDGGAFAVIASKTAATSLTQPLNTGHSYRYEVRARDRAGNLTSWVAGPTLRQSLTQQASSAVRWSGSWTTLSDAGFSGGSARTASTAGATASLAFSGRAVSLVMSRDPSYGQVKVYIDGTYRATIDTTAASHVDQSVVYARILTWGSHTIKVVTVGTAGRPQVVLDAFGVIR